MTTTLPLTRRSFGAGLLGSAALASAACAAGEAGRPLRVAYGAIGTNRHPHMLANIPDTDIANVLFDPILTLAPDGTPTPVLAEHYEQVSPTRWRFVLRRGVTFHDGRPLQAPDAKFSLENYLRPEVPNSYLYTGWLDHVEVVDDYTFEVVAKKPYRVAIANMSYLSHVVPRDTTDLQAFAKNPIGSGPYRQTEFVPNNRLVAVANESYWGGKPKLPGIVFRQLAEDSTRVAALLAREVDFAGSVPVDDISRVRAAGINAVTQTTVRMMYLRFNFLVDGPMRDVRVRRAMNHAVDRKGLMEAFLGGQGAETIAPVPTGTRFRRTDLPSLGYDLTLAKKLLAEAGVPNGFSATLATPVGRYYRDREIAEAVAGQLEQVGIRLKLQPLEWATFLQQERIERLTTGKTYAVSLMAWGNLTRDMDFGTLIYDGTNTAWNLGSYDNPKAQELIEQGRAEFDEGKLADLYGRLQAILWEDVPFLSLFELPVTNGLLPGVKGFVPQPNELVDWKLVSLAT